MSAHPDRLSRSLGLTDAVIIGLCSMLGAGIFIGLGPAAAAAGTGMLLGLLLAAAVAFCNATSSAQLAALYPESGGAYAYGRKRLGRFLGWLAGWAFLVGKIASCAAAALAFGLYVDARHARGLALVAVAVLAAVNYRGIRTTVYAVRVAVAVVLAALVVVTAASLLGESVDIHRLAHGWTAGGFVGILRSAGFLFFAFAGYARIATLGEEVKDPERTIPRATVLALALVLGIYAIVCAGVLVAVGPETLASASAPLAVAVHSGRLRALSPVVTVGAATATLSVLLSLLAAVSRTVFAMAANRELPSALAAVHPRFKVPHRAEIAVAVLVGALVVWTDARSAVGLSAFTVLVYYAVANASAFTLAPRERCWPRAFTIVGFLGCLLLAANLPRESLLAGTGLLAFGCVAYACRRMHSAAITPGE